MILRWIEGQNRTGRKREKERERERERERDLFIYTGMTLLRINMIKFKQ